MITLNDYFTLLFLVDYYKYVLIFFKYFLVFFSIKLLTLQLKIKNYLIHGLSILSIL